MSNSYNEAFYRRYHDYLEEPSVREAHNWIFQMVASDRAFEKVVDLGCGTSKEFQRYAKPFFYFGVDNQAPGAHKADYRKDDLVVLLGSFTPTAFVSLFSTEITAPADSNYDFYDYLFSESAWDIEAGLVSGFFYASKRDQPMIWEECGSGYQTIDEITNHNLYTERRIIMPVPSVLFGNDVFEVWKFFRRR